MGPRANFMCKNCCTTKGEHFKIEDLPVDSIRCPLCGRKRGFRRLFDAIGGVMTGNTRTVDKVMDMTLDPLYQKHSEIKHGAQSFERAATAAIDRSIHEASPAERATAEPFKPHVMPAAQALGSIPHAARQDCREAIYPALTMKKVIPNWER